MVVEADDGWCGAMVEADFVSEHGWCGAMVEAGCVANRRSRRGALAFRALIVSSIGTNHSYAAAISSSGRTERKSFARPDADMRDDSSMPMEEACFSVSASGLSDAICSKQMVDGLLIAATSMLPM